MVNLPRNSWKESHHGTSEEQNPLVSAPPGLGASPRPLQRRDIYLGPYGSPESQQAYARFIAENVGNGKPPTITIPEGERLAIAALVVKYDDFAQAYYVKNGIPTDEKYAIKAAVAPLVRLYGDTPADEFGPKRLKAVRQEIVTKGRSASKSIPVSR